MTVFLNEGRDVQGYNVFAPYQSGLKYSATLAANTHSTVTVPSNYANWIAEFSYEVGNVWVSIGGTAAVPAGSTFAATTSQRCPAKLSVKAADVIDVISADATMDVSIVLYAIS